MNAFSLKQTTSTAVPSKSGCAASRCIILSNNFAVKYIFKWYESSLPKLMRHMNIDIK